MKHRLRAVASCERQQRAAHGPDEHARHGSRRVMVLTQDVPDARAFACSQRSQSLQGKGFLLVKHDDAWFVLDAGAPIERANEVLRLLAGRPRSAGAEAEALVEVTDLGYERCPEEDREGDCAVPKIFTGQTGGIGSPRREGPSVLDRGPPGRTDQPPRRSQ